MFLQTTWHHRLSKSTHEVMPGLTAMVSCSMGPGYVLIWFDYWCLVRSILNSNYLEFLKYYIQINSDKSSKKKNMIDLWPHGKEDTTHLLSLEPCQWNSKFIYVVLWHIINIWTAKKKNEERKEEVTKI